MKIKDEDATTEEIRADLIKEQPLYTDFWKTASEDDLRFYTIDKLEPYNAHGFEAKSTSQHTKIAKTLATEKRERRLSQKLNNQSIKQADLDQEAHIPRTFIRTWVRFVKIR